MDSWQSVALPRLPGEFRQRVTLRDVLTNTAVPVGPESGKARIYACGITPYDAAHLGHAFTYLGIDTLIRAWLDAGLRVHYVQNVTDVDDPLLERASATGTDWRELATAQIDLFRRDMEALRIVPPTTLRGVVESMDVVTAAIDGLRERGRAYQIADADFPDWYFHLTDPENLVDRSGVPAQQAEAIFAERGGDPARAGKQGRFDSLLWRVPRPGEPHWVSTLGDGRPGWHVECAAIALHELGDGIDVQAGGRDLVFPHHPMSATQAEALTGRQFAKVGMHMGMVGYRGEKMSKSLGNLVFVHELLTQGADPMAIRLMLLAQHYRCDWFYSAALLDAAKTRLAAWRAGLSRSSGPPVAEVLDQARKALRTDLDTSTVLALVDQWSVEKGSDAAAPAQMSAVVDALLGVVV